MEQFSRRSFLKGAGLAAVGTAAVGLVGCGSAAAQEQKDWWMPEAWDEETDVVVVGTARLAWPPPSPVWTPAWA